MNNIFKIVSIFIFCSLLVQVVSAQDDAKARLGERVYNMYCATCHGDNMINSGNASFDLRRLKIGEKQRFEQSVTNGTGRMPPWRGVVSQDQIDQLWSYVRINANDK